MQVLSNARRLIEGGRAALVLRALATLALAAVVAVVVSRGVSPPSTPRAVDSSAGKVGGEIAELVPGTVQEGSRIYVTGRDGSVRACTIGAVPRPGTAVTAAHCGLLGDAVTLSQDADAPRVGHISRRFTDSDVAIIALVDQAAQQTEPTRIASYDDGLPAGMRVAAHGATSGRSPGHIPTGTLTSTTSTGPDGIAHTVTVVESTACLQPGDSGGPVYQAGTDVVVAIAVSTRDRVRNQCRSLVSPVTQWRMGS